MPYENASAVLQGSLRYDVTDEDALVYYWMFTQVRKLARMRSVAPPPDEEPDLLHPTRVDLATGQRQPSINENQRIIRLVASLKKYLGMAPC